MVQTGVIWGSVFFLLFALVLSFRNWLSMTKDTRQQQLAGLLGGAGSGIDAADVANFIRLMGWDKVEAFNRMAHAQSMVKSMFGPKQHRASLAVYREVLDQISITRRVEPQFASVDDNPNTSDHQTYDGMLHVHGSDWRIAGQTLRRSFEYRGLIGQHSVHRVQIDIDKSESLFRGVNHYHFSLLLSPNPWPDMDEGYLTGHLAPEKDDLVNYPFVAVRCGPCDDGSFIIGAIDRDGTHAMLTAIAQCVSMRFQLIGTEGPLLELPVPNDDSFSRASVGFFE